MSVSHPPEDERLRQFLQWREDTGRAPQPRLLTGKQVYYSGLAGIAVGTVLASVLVLSFLPDWRPREVRPSTAAVTREPPAPVTAEPPPLPRQSDDQRVAAVEPAPELPPRPAKRLATQPPVDRRPPRPSLPISDLPNPPPALELPPTPDAPAAADPAIEPPTSARQDQRSDATAPAPPPENPPAAIRTPSPHPPINRLTMRSPGVVESPPPAPVVRAPTTPPAAPETGESRIETLKRLAGYIPEVWLARKIAAWVKTQPPPDGVPQPDPELEQAR